MKGIVWRPLEEILKTSRSSQILSVVVVVVLVRAARQLNFFFEGRILEHANGPRGREITQNNSQKSDIAFVEALAWTKNGGLGRQPPFFASRVTLTVYMYTFAGGATCPAGSF